MKTAYGGFNVTFVCTGFPQEIFEGLWDCQKQDGIKSK